MYYFSTNHQSGEVDFRQAVLQGQPPDRGLYFPEHIPQLPANFFKNLPHLSKEDIAFEVIRPYVGQTMEEEVLRGLVAETVSFDFPLVALSSRISTLELFHGPTLAFKDVGARFMSRCLGFFAKDEKRPVTVLVATSGDTGGAVADAFAAVENVRVIVLYPSGKVSDIQERQLTTLGQNVTALEINGSFDDCQRMVKEAFADKALAGQQLLTSANSINVARWLPQQFYYFYAQQQWLGAGPPVISVPSGNLGNLCAGMLAHLSGLPVRHFIAACNANNAIAGYILSGNFQPKETVYTLSNAMDVGHPSNFVRLLQLFHHHHPAIRSLLSSYTVTDDETAAAIRDVKKEQNYLLDPHGAVGYVALSKYLEEQHAQEGYFLETAHPVKFDTEAITNEEAKLPASVTSLLQRVKKSIRMEADGEALKDFLSTTAR